MTAVPRHADVAEREAQRAQTQLAVGAMLVPIFSSRRECPAMRRSRSSFWASSGWHWGPPSCPPLLADAGDEGLYWETKVTAIRAAQVRKAACGFGNTQDGLQPLAETEIGKGTTVHARVPVAGREPGAAAR